MVKTAKHPRYLWLDVSRGLAVCAMIIYHFIFDLSWFQLINVNFYEDSIPRITRALIVFSFLFIVGISLRVAGEMQQRSTAFWRRFIKISLCALLVTVASYFAFPQSFIYFGILHFIALASLLAHPFVRVPKVAFVVGIAVIVAGLTLASPLFNPRYLSWIGFVTELPRTEDFVPLFPWLGVVLLGIAFQATSWGFKKQSVAVKHNIALRSLSWAGRRSLWIYMLHQPILIGVLWLILYLYT
jgi:Predicted membrane protein